MKASAFRRWPVAGAYSPEQTTRLTGGSDFQEGTGEKDFLLWLSLNTLLYIDYLRDDIKKRG